MSIFGSIVNAIFGTAKTVGGAIAGTVAAATGTKPKPMTREEVEAMIQKKADETGRSNYNWKQSIVDLMKLLDLDFEPQRPQGARQGARLYRRARRLRRDEHLAAQDGDGEADGVGRHGAGRPEIGFAPAFGLSPNDRAARMVRAALLVAVVVAYAARTTLYPSS